MNLNKVIISGSLARDSSVKTSASNMQYYFNAIGNTVSRRDPNGQWINNTHWYTIKCFGKSTDMFKGLGKGSLIVVEGALRVEEMTLQSGEIKKEVVIMVERVHKYARPVSNANKQQYNNRAGDMEIAPTVNVDDLFATDDVPF